MKRGITVHSTANVALVLAAVAAWVGVPAPNAAQPPTTSDAAPATMPADVLAGLERIGQRALAPGVAHEQWRSPAPLSIHVLRINLDEPSLDFEAVPGADNLATRERPSSAAARLSRPGHVAIAAINADMGARARNAPMAMFVREGELLVSPSRRTVLSLTKDRQARIGTFTTDIKLIPTTGGEAITVAAFNRVGDLEGPRLFSSLWLKSEKREAEVGEVMLRTSGRLDVPSSRVDAEVVSVSSSPGQTPIPDDHLVLQMSADSIDRDRFVAGENWSLQLAMDPAIPDVETVCGGVPRLLVDGEVVIPWKEEGVTIETFATSRHPRTGAGLDASGRQLILATTDGRQPGHSVGLTLDEHARLLLRLGAHNAANFDGGGSTTMVIEGAVVNKPSDKQGERATTSSLVIFSSAAVMPTGS